MYNFIKTASDTYAKATGKDPIIFAKKLASKLGVPFDEEKFAATFGRKKNQTPAPVEAPAQESKKEPENISVGGYPILNGMKFKMLTEELAFYLKGNKLYQNGNEDKNVLNLIDVLSEVKDKVQRKDGIFFLPKEEGKVDRAEINMIFSFPENDETRNASFERQKKIYYQCRQRRAAQRRQ